GWDTPAVLGGHRAVGQLLLIGPEYEARSAGVRLLGAAAGERSDGGAGQGVLAPLAGPGALATAVAPDALRLRRLLDEAAVAAAAE
ncbi:urease accessory protein UreD, partial [Streptomyces decoyicus]